MILSSVAHNLRLLFSFSGSDTRERFWPYSLIVIILVLAAYMAIVAPEMLAMIVEMVQSGKVTIPDLSHLTWWTCVSVAALVLMLAASVTRRLRDRGKPVGWALLPLALIVLLLPIVANPLLLTQLPSWGLFAIFLLDLGYQASLIYLIVLLATNGRVEESVVS